MFPIWVFSCWTLNIDNSISIIWALSWWRFSPWCSIGVCPYVQCVPRLAMGAVTHRGRATMFSRPWDPAKLCSSSPDVLGTHPFCSDFGDVGLVWKEPHLSGKSRGALFWGISLLCHYNLGRPQASAHLGCLTCPGFMASGLWREGWGWLFCIPCWLLFKWRRSCTTYVWMHGAKKKKKLNN